MEFLRHVPTYALSLREGLHTLSEDNFDLVFLDVCLPDRKGLRSVPKIKELNPWPEVIITGRRVRKVLN